MNIIYKNTKSFAAAELKRLFSSVGWLSADYSERLVKALAGSGSVFSAWDGERLVGLINALDDGELTAYVHYLLVDPEYHGRKIGSALVKMLTERYKDCLYIVLTPESRKLLPFYEQFGFEESKNSLCVARTNLAGKDGE